MGLSHEHVGPKILAKIQIYVLTTAELLFTLCSEILAESHFGQNDTLARDTLAGTLWPE